LLSWSRRPALCVLRQHRIYRCTTASAELNIAIRTLLRIGEDLYAWAGGGIVADSDAEAEYQECFDKMGALMRALETGN
jgi:para-aminobenzoate synthetase component 1